MGHAVVVVELKTPKPFLSRTSSTRAYFQFEMPICFKIFPLDIKWNKENCAMGKIERWVDVFGISEAQRMQASERLWNLNWSGHLCMDYDFAGMFNA